LIAAFRNTYAGMFPQIGDCCPDGGICESCALLVEKAEAALDAESAEPETGAGTFPKLPTARVSPLPPIRRRDV
jgi:hypothetical protein